MSRRLKALLGSSVTALALTFAVTGSGAPGTSTRIAYVGTDAIYLSNIDGTARELIVRGVEDHTTFSWSPDGRRLAFSGGHKRATEIFAVNVDGSGVKRLTYPPLGRRRGAMTTSKIRAGRRTGTRSLSTVPGSRPAVSFSRISM